MAPQNIKLEPQLDTGEFTRPTPQGSIPPQDIEDPDNQGENEEDLNSKIDRMRHRDKQLTAARLDNKRNEIDKARGFLKQMQNSLLQPNSYKIPEFLDWIDDVEKINAQHDTPKRLLGVMGDSGCGKSSLINALIGEELLPRSCMGEACTAVPVEIKYKPYDPDVREEGQAGAKYYALVHMINEHEWRADLEALVQEVVNTCETSEENAISDDVKAAAEKIRVVYPEVDPMKVKTQDIPHLMADRIVDSYLGKQVKIGESKASDFASTLGPFIDGSPTTNRGNFAPSAAKWPLIKKVEVFCPAEALKTGLVLVDLPGLSDSCRAREMVTEQYLSEVSALCIVADIKRAITNAVAKNLHCHGKSLKQKFLRDGILDDEHMFFVLTMTDIIDIDEVIQKYELTDANLHGDTSRVIKELNDMRSKNTIIEKIDEEISQINKMLDSWNETRDKFNQILRKRKSPGADSSKGSEGLEDKLETVTCKIQTAEERQKSLEEKRKTLIQEVHGDSRGLSELEYEVAARCIEIRNSYVRQRIRADFRSGLQELDQELKSRGDDDDQGSSLMNLTSGTYDGAQSFCVSSSTYQKWKKKRPMPTGFRTEQDTCIPQLRKYCQEFTLGSREGLATQLLEDVNRLKKRMKGWADNSIPDVQLTRGQNQKAKDLFQKHAARLEEELLDNIRSCIGDLEKATNKMHKHALETVIPGLDDDVSEVLDGWDDQITATTTWKAICRKKGSHKGRSQGEQVTYEWNRNLSELFIKAMSTRWAAFTNNQIMEIKQQQMSKIKNIMDEFQEALTYSCTGISSHIANPLANFTENLAGHNIRLNRGIEGHFLATVTKSRSADTQVLSKIEAKMEHGYGLSLKAKAKPRTKTHPAITLLQNCKIILFKYISDNASAMFTDAEVEAHWQFNAAVSSLNNKLKDATDAYMEEVRKDFATMLSRASATPREGAGPEKAGLQKQVLIKLGEFDQVLGKLKGEQSHKQSIDMPVIKMEDLGDKGDEGTQDGGGDSDDEPEIEVFDFEGGSGL